MKSTYSFPSRSQTRDPRPRSSTTGPGEYTAAPRDGEFTPSISDCCARSYHSRDRSRLFVLLIFVVIEFEVIKIEAAETGSEAHQSNRSRQPPTIDDQRSARDERRRIAREIQRGLRNFLWRPHPAQRTLGRCGKKAAVLFSELLRFFAQHASIGVAGADAIHANLLRSGVDGHRFRQQHDGSLRSTVNRSLRAASQSPS